MVLLKRSRSRFGKVKKLAQLVSKIWRFDYEPVRVSALIRYIENTLGGRASYKNKLPTTSKNDVWPWYTYPAIEYLCQYDFSNCSVFEYGSGNSSRFWAQRALNVKSIESNPEWYETLKSELAENQVMLLFSDKIDYVNSINSSDQLFDIIIIDGVFRFNCVIEAVKRVNPGGIIILDNSDWYPNSAKILRENGFDQIDFIGWGPINSYAWCTSVFAKEGNNIPRKNTKKIMVLGGISQFGEDDKLI